MGLIRPQDEGHDISARSDHCRRNLEVRSFRQKGTPRNSAPAKTVHDKMVNHVSQVVLFLKFLFFLQNCPNSLERGFVLENVGKNPKSWETWFTILSCTVFAGADTMRRRTATRRGVARSGAATIRQRTAAWRGVAQRGAARHGAAR